MKKYISLILILVTLLSLAGCASLKRDRQEGLSVVDPTIVLGGEPPVQQISYRLVLHNGSEQKIRVVTVKPVVDSAFKAMLGKQDLALAVDKDILPGEDLEVSGKFRLKTNGIPKEELQKMGTLVKSFQISSRQSFTAPEIQTEEPAQEQAKTKATPKPKAAKAKP